MYYSFLIIVIMAIFHLNYSGIRIFVWKIHLSLWFF